MGNTDFADRVADYTDDKQGFSQRGNTDFTDGNTKAVLSPLRKFKHQIPRMQSEIRIESNEGLK